jgi:hypothetical protein
MTNATATTTPTPAIVVLVVLGELARQWDGNFDFWCIRCIFEHKTPRLVVTIKSSNDAAINDACLQSSSAA